MIELGRLAASDERAIREFNARLSAGGEVFQLPGTLAELATPSAPGPALWTEAWVAREDQAVRGGFLLKHEWLLTPQQRIEVGNFQLPLSEGIIDRRYAMVGLNIVHHAIKQLGPLYCLGMGSLSRPLPRLLQRLEWRVEEVPFYFLVLRGARFARNIRILRTRKRNRVALDLLGMSGIASLGALGWRVARWATGRGAAGAGIQLRPVAAFDRSSDEIQARCRPEYQGFLDRGQEALAIKFPAGDPRFHRYMVSEGGRDVGWLIATVTRLKDHKQFGDLTLATIVDGLVPKSLLRPALDQLVGHLRRLDADLIVSNQSDSAWCAALRRSMFRRGPSNFVLARSPAFLPEAPLGAIHMNRGDGDGPINL
ncbi:MAG: hypothetical protein JSS29_05315 [Proteobacteria bacterium]|nr:hypothetical protein [Pseudomonadota bacterium]